MRASTILALLLAIALATSMVFADDKDKDEKGGAPAGTVAPSDPGASGSDGKSEAAASSSANMQIGQAIFFIVSWILFQ